MFKIFGLNKLLFRVLTFLEIDLAVMFAILWKVWSIGAGLVTTLLVASFFTSELQGYYYTFYSVLALQVFAEFGLGTVISTYASHEWASLSLDAKGNLIGDKDAISRLISLGNFALRWYLVAGLVVVAFLMFGGFLLFGFAGRGNVSVWGWPWVVLCIVTGLNLCFMPVWALLEGCNQVSNLYLFRLVQSVASGIAAWVGIYLGAELWVISIIGIVALIVAVVTNGYVYGKFIRMVMLGQSTGFQLNWRADILPMQWRVALSWLSGYLTFSLFTPVLFHYQGPVVAGQMGMTLSLTTALIGIASSWIAPKSPIFGMLIVQHKYAELDRIFWRITKSVALVVSFGGLVIWILIWALATFNHPLSMRLLSPPSVACLIIASIIVALSMPMSTYLRAHKKEPLLGVSLSSGMITGIMVVVTARYFSVIYVAIGYLIVMALLTPFVVFVWYRCRKEWHPNPESSITN